MSATAPEPTAQAESPVNKAKAIAHACERLLVFHAVVESEQMQVGLQLLRNADDVGAATQAYIQLFRLLAVDAELATSAAPGDAWQQHIVQRLLTTESLLSSKSRRHAYQQLGSTTRDAINGDLDTLAALYHLGGSLLRSLASVKAPAPPLDGFLPRSANVVPNAALRDRLHTTERWSTLTDLLAEHYKADGVGQFASHRAFRWRGAHEKPVLQGVRHPDPIRLSDLIGDHQQRDLIRHNTEHFLAGLPANNVLLYGDRGTGKSSTVKALLNEYGDQGLRLIEVGRTQLNDFPIITDLLADLPERFIIFVDDLSFDEHETSYKDLKAVLEGGIEARPANVIVCATSNRRHLVKERHSDRAQPGDDELHGFDTVQEKLSLADRFGITLTFVTPGQEQYLEIVRGLAERRGIVMPDDSLRQQALQWAAWHNGRSGRSARQFIDYLSGESALR